MSAREHVLLNLQFRGFIQHCLTKINSNFLIGFNFEQAALTIAQTNNNFPQIYPQRFHATAILHCASCCSAFLSLIRTFRIFRFFRIRSVVAVYVDGIRFGTEVAVLVGSSSSVARLHFSNFRDLWPVFTIRI